MKRLSLVSVAGLLFVLLLFTGCGSKDGASKQTTELQKRDVIAANGVVAAAHPSAAQVGLRVLESGGNAFDAAVATAFTLGVVEPNASGLGGGGFAILYVAKEQKSYVVDFREVAPAKGKAEIYKRDEKGKVLNDAMGTGWYSSGVPGEVAGMELINKRFGSKQWNELIKPAIQQAEEGIIVSKNLNKITTDEFDRMQKFPSKAFFEKTFIKDGLPVQPGDKVINRDYAESLKKIANGGADVFYKGEIAEAIAREYEKDGNSWITKADLENYKAVIREPLTSMYRGYTIEVVPPPSSGGLTVAEMLNILEGYNIAQMGPGSADYIHSFVEAQKIAFADRGKYIGDPDFIQVPMTGLINKKYAEDQRKRINPTMSSSDKVKYGDPTPYEAGSTTSFSIIDKEGNMITVTKSINHFYGGGVVPEGTGILMNDHMQDFDEAPGKINSPEPGKRPLSSMSPTIVLKDNKPFMTLGTPGGTRIIPAIVNVLVNVIDFGMDLQPAIEAARFHNPNGKAVDIESNISPETIKLLESRGHQFKLKDPLDLYFGGVQGVMYGQDGKIHGAADPRRDGVAVGY